jgi:hypothetical protein
MVNSQPYSQIFDNPEELFRYKRSSLFLPAFGNNMCSVEDLNSFQLHCPSFVGATPTNNFVFIFMIFNNFILISEGLGCVVHAFLFM